MNNIPMRKSILVTYAVLILRITLSVNSFIFPLSLSQQGREQPFKLSSSKPTKRRLAYSKHLTSVRTKHASKTLLWAVSIDGTELSASGRDEPEIGKDNLLGINDVSKFRQLKDVMWIREALEDITASEFALSVEYQVDASPQENRSVASRKTKKRAVDYEKLLGQLTKRVEDITCQPFLDTADLYSDSGVLELDSGLGMGRYAYSDEERLMLMEYVKMLTLQYLFENCVASIPDINHF